MELFKTNSNGTSLKLRNSEKVIEQSHCYIINIQSRYIIGISAICISQLVLLLFMSHRNLNDSYVRCMQFGRDDSLELFSFVSMSIDTISRDTLTTENCTLL